MQKFYVSINGSYNSKIFSRENPDIVTPLTGEITFTSKPGKMFTSMYSELNQVTILFESTVYISNMREPAGRENNQVNLNTMFYFLKYYLWGHGISYKS